jgi:hypothetical protein
MGSSFRTTVVYFISIIAIVACLGICAPAVADNSGDADLNPPIASVPEPSVAVLSGLGIAGIALVRWIKKR